MTDQEEELERLRAENAKLKAKVNQPVTFKVSSKGGVSVYGLGQRFPVTLYKEQWLRLLERAPDLHEFIRANGGKLKGKE